MKVERYLGKYGGPVFTVEPETTIAEASRRFGHVTGGKRFSLAVVTDSNEGVVGVISLGDIVYALGLHEEAAAKMLVKEVMTQDVFTCSPGDVLEDVLKGMAERGVRHTPVIKDGKLEGLVARRDALEFLYQWAKVDVDHLSEWLFGSHARY
jgi:CBS domain-containing protein